MRKRPHLLAAACIALSALLYGMLSKPSTETPQPDKPVSATGPRAKADREPTDETHRRGVAEKRIKGERQKQMNPAPLSAEEVIDKIENTPWSFSPPDNSPQLTEEDAARREAENRKNELIGQHLNELGPKALDMLLAEQDLDFDWTHRISTEGEEFLREHYDGTTVNAVDCHSLVCRIELKHASKESSEEFMDSNGGARGPWAIRQFGVQQERDGQHYSLLYIERDATMATFKRMDDVMWDLMQKAGVAKTALN